LLVENKDLKQGPFQPAATGCLTTEALQVQNKLKKNIYRL
jgi:hypothetical protein